VGEQSSFFSLTELDNGDPQTVSFQITGLHARDTVDVQWVASRSGSGTRAADLTQNFVRIDHPEAAWKAPHELPLLPSHHAWQMELTPPRGFFRVWLGQTVSE